MHVNAVGAMVAALLLTEPSLVSAPVPLEGMGFAALCLEVQQVKRRRLQ